MKKRTLKGLALLCSAVTAFTCFSVYGAACGESDTGAKLKVGLISDPHCITTTTWNGNFARSLSYFKEQAVDAIVIAGDITDKAFASNYAVYNKTISDVFGDERPEIITTMGNHDFWKVHSIMSPKDEMYELYEEEVGVAPNYHTTVKGYHFISVSPDTDSLNYNSSVEWLAEQMEQAASDKPEQPIFITAHTNGENTTPGASSRELSKVLENYPQAMLFSGHTHYACQDERTIYQENFTSVDLGSVAYSTIVDKNYENKPSTTGQINLFVRLLTVEKDEMKLERICVNTGEVEKQPYVFKLPLSKDTFTYTSARAENAIAPEFASDAKITVTPTEISGAIKVAFPSATHETDMVYAYRIRIAEEGASLPLVNKYYATDFYKGVKSIKVTNEYAIGGLTPGKTYQITVTARESFGKFSTTPLTITYTVPSV